MPCSSTQTDITNVFFRSWPCTIFEEDSTKVDVGMQCNLQHDVEPEQERVVHASKATQVVDSWTQDNLDDPNAEWF